VALFGSGFVGWFHPFSLLVPFLSFPILPKAMFYHLDGVAEK
jgi:hypothetical protein